MECSFVTCPQWGWGDGCVQLLCLKSPTHENLKTLLWKHVRESDYCRVYYPSITQLKRGNPILHLVALYSDLFHTKTAKLLLHFTYRLLQKYWHNKAYYLVVVFFLLCIEDTWLTRKTCQSLVLIFVNTWEKGGFKRKVHIFLVV